MDSSNRYNNFTDCKENFNMNMPNQRNFNVLKEHPFQGSQMNGVNFINDHPNPKSDEIRHSGMECGFSVNYVEFESIPLIQQNDQLESYFEHIKTKFSSGDWIQAFDAVNDLRSLNKSFPQFANEIFRMFGEFVMYVAKSTKPALNRNLLAFFNEVLIQATQSDLDDKVIDNILLILIKKAISTSTNISGLADVCLNTLIQNCSNEHLTQTLCHHSVNKNINISQIAFQHLGNLLGMLKDKISQLSDDCFRMVFMTLSFNLNSKSTKNKTLAKNILKFLYNQLQQNFINYLDHLVKNGYLNIDDKREIAKVVTKTRPSYIDKSNEFKSLVYSARKSTLPRQSGQMMNQCGNMGFM